MRGVGDAEVDIHRELKVSEAGKHRPLLPHLYFIVTDDL